MPVKIILGTSHGDEGKGRVVDDLVQTWADVVIRFQGGGNAGHTVYDKEGNKYVTHQLPVGVLDESKLNIISKGCVLNPVDVYKETKSLNLKKFNLKISGLCPIIEPTHILKDKLKYQGRIGTTAKGIGPAYSDYYARDSILFRDLVNDHKLSMEKIKDKFFKFQTYTKLFISDQEQLNKNFEFFNDWIRFYEDSVSMLKEFVIENENIFQDLFSDRLNILLEGAQGYGLSIDSQNYPNVTSSFPTIGGALNATGYNHTQIEEVIGVSKIYKTKVGSGDFFSRCNKDDEEVLAREGKEFGATTGRPRKCGWLDIDELKESVLKNGITHLCVTKSDVFKHINKPFVFYNNELIEVNRFDSVDISDESFRNILTMIKELTGVKTISYTTGPKRGQIVWKAEL